MFKFLKQKQKIEELEERLKNGQRIKEDEIFEIKKTYKREIDELRYKNQIDCKKISDEWEKKLNQAEHQFSLFKTELEKKSELMIKEAQATIAKNEAKSATEMSGKQDVMHQTMFKTLIGGIEAFSTINGNKQGLLDESKNPKKH